MQGNDFQEMLFQSVSIREHYSQIWNLMRGLHENERQLYPKTALWSDIGFSYMKHVIYMQDHCNGICIVAWWRDDIIGFIFGYTEEEDESRCEEASGTIAYISDGFVMPNWRGKSVYSTLNSRLESCFAEMGIKRFTRFTLWNNEPMKAFLEQQGYTITRLLYEKWI